MKNLAGWAGLVVLLLSGMGGRVWAEDTGVDAPVSALNQTLPKWIRLGAEYRFRMEGYTALRYREDNDDRWFLNRVRANVTLAPTAWWSVTLQGQDSRIFFKSNPNGQGPYTNRTDLRLAYLDLGDAGRGAVVVRVGRQELAYGEERLVGAGNWGNVARSFDAAKLILRRGAWQWDLVSAAVVAPQVRGVSHHLQGNNLHLVYGQWHDDGNRIQVQPYLLWRVGGGDALQSVQHQSRWVSGLRLAGKLPRHFDYTTEWSMQSGSVRNAFGQEEIRAFGEHSVLRHGWENLAWHPRVVAEWNYASGDDRPGDGRSGTFDQLYPTPHEKYGLADQVGWQNVQHFAGGVEMNPKRQFQIRAFAHDWYLASARDGLYVAGGGLAFRDLTGSSGRHVGEEIDLIAQYSWGARYAGGGYGHLFPGGFLRAQSPGVGVNYVYLNVGFRF